MTEERFERKRHFSGWGAAQGERSICMLPPAAAQFYFGMVREYRLTPSGKGGRCLCSVQERHLFDAADELRGGLRRLDVPERQPELQHLELRATALRARHVLLDVL